MEGAPPGFIKLSLQIAVDVDALTAIVDDGHKVKFVGGELYPFVPAPLVLTGQVVVQDGPGPVEIAVCLCPSDHAAEQAAAGVPEYLGVLLRREVLFQPDPYLLPIPVIEQIKKLPAAPELVLLIPARIKLAALLTAAVVPHLR